MCFCWCCMSKQDFTDKIGPKNVFKVKALLTTHLWVYYILMHDALVWETILRQSLVCVHIFGCLWENKNHCLLRLRKLPLPFFPPRSPALPAFIDRPSADYWSVNLYQMIIAMSFSNAESQCVCIISFILAAPLRAFVQKESDRTEIFFSAMLFRQFLSL